MVEVGKASVGSGAEGKGADTVCCSCCCCFCRKEVVERGREENGYPSTMGAARRKIGADEGKLPTTPATIEDL